MKKKLYLLLLGLCCLSLAACDLWPASTANDTPSVEEPGTTPDMITPSPTEPPLPPNTFGVIDNTTLNGKVIVGYQGWFGCAGDTSPFNKWMHWFEYDNVASLDRLTIDYWPDVSELGEDELCDTGLVDTEGKPLYLYSNFNPTTTQRHFLWMAEYGIDGAEVQRFVSPQPQPNVEGLRNQVLENAVAGAEKYGRVFFIQYAGSPLVPEVIERIKVDWEKLVDEEQITESPSYLYHNGLPVVAIWGFGFYGQNIEPEQALDLIDFFQNNPDPKYRAVVQGGVPSHWRTLDRSSRQEPEWQQVYHALDIINPWHVSGIHDYSSADVFLNEVIIPDLEETRALGIDYMPIVFPGFSTFNLKNNTYNGIPRLGGRFMWKLAVNVIAQEVEMIEIAMYDEVDEGTQVYKVVERAEQLAAENVLIPLDVDGYPLPSDWYLTLSGRIGEMLRGERPLTTEIEDLPQRDIGEAVLLLLDYSTGANWNRLEVNNPTIVRSLIPSSLEGEVIAFSTLNHNVTINQTLSDAQAGKMVSVTLEFLLNHDTGMDSLNLLLTKGSIGTATLRFYTLLNGVEIELFTLNHAITPGDSSGRNPKEISIAIEDILGN